MARSHKRKKQSHPARRKRLQHQTKRACFPEESGSLVRERKLSVRLGEQIDRLNAKLGSLLKRFWNAKAEESNT